MRGQRQIRIVLILVAVAVVTALAVSLITGRRGDSGSGSEIGPGAAPQPWAELAAKGVRAKFSHPAIVAVSYRIGQTQARVTVTFAQPEICGGCSAAKGSSLPQSRRATFVFNVETHRLTEFALG